MVRSPARASSCLGNALRDSGHNRVPEPPERMTGVMTGSLLMAATCVRGGRKASKGARKPLILAQNQGLGDLALGEILPGENLALFHTGLVERVSGGAHSA